MPAFEQLTQKAAPAATFGPGPSSAGMVLDARKRNDLEARMGADFWRVRIHADSAAATAARELDAAAYTVGNAIVFAAGRFEPGTAAGDRLLAHELSHVAQQQHAALQGNRPISSPGDPAERDAEAVAAEIGGPDVSPGGTRAIRYLAPTAVVQRQYAASTSTPVATTSDPDALIPVADFIRFVEEVERGFPTAPPTEILTRIRQQYYKGLGFDELIPDAPYRRISGFLPQRGGGARPTYVPNTLSDLPRTPAADEAKRHLTARADENGIQRNPSPYIVMPDGSRIDAGHLFLALDSLIHPRVDSPYTAYGIPGIDPAGLAADLALASFWTTYHAREGHPAGDAAIKPATADFNAYYAASAPDEDLLGDIDAFGAHQQWTATPGRRVSEVLRSEYLGSGGGRPATDQRYRTFSARNGFAYTVAGGSVTWSTTAIEATWGPRIDRMCDLFDSGFLSRVGSVTIGTSPSRGTWPYSLPALRRFLTWLKPRLEAEIAANP